MFDWFRYDVPPLLQVVLVIVVLGGLYELASKLISATCR